MKTVISLGLVMVMALTTQVYLEKKAAISPDETENEADTSQTRFKIEGGKFYFLNNEAHWVEKHNFVWRGSDGYLYHINGEVIYRSYNGKQWEVAFHLSSAERSLKQSPILVNDITINKQ